MADDDPEDTCAVRRGIALAEAAMDSAALIDAEPIKDGVQDCERDAGNDILGDEEGVLESVLNTDIVAEASWLADRDGDDALCDVAKVADGCGVPVSCCEGVIVEVRKSDEAVCAGAKDPDAEPLRLLDCDCEVL